MAPAMVSPRITLGANAVRIASVVLAVVFPVLGATELLLVRGADRLPLMLAAGASAALCLVLWRISPALSERWNERVLVTLCLVPLVNIFLAMALTREIELTAILMLTLVGIGAITVRWRQPIALIGLSYAGWLVVTLTQRSASVVSISHYALQLLLAGVLAGVLFQVRASSSRDLNIAGRRLAAQVRELAAGREERERMLHRYRSLFHDGPVGNSLTDEDGVIVEINPAIEVLLGRPAAEILGHSPLDFTHRDDIDLNIGAADLMAQAADGVARMELRFLRPDGEIRWATVSVTAVAGPGDEPWTLAQVQDITERKQMELDLVRSRDAMAAAAEIASAVQRGEDPRPIVIAHLQKLARARDVAVIEPGREGHLVITASLRGDLVGVELPLHETSATVQVWQTSEALFISDLATSPVVSTRLRDSWSASSMLWQPVGLPGDLDAVLSIGWGDTVAEVTDVEREAVRSVAAELSAALIAERLRQSLEERTRLDPLTGLLNRRGWDHEVAELVDQSRRAGQPFVLAVVDLDHFKQFNDAFGHLEGDILLAGFAEAARAALRDADALARWGGEEFAIALHNCPLAAAAPVLDRVRQAVPAGQTCSIGYASYDPSESVIECMRRVDEALYRAKQAGRNRLECSLSPAPSSAAGPGQRRAVPR